MEFFIVFVWKPLTLMPSVILLSLKPFWTVPTVILLRCVFLKLFSFERVRMVPQRCDEFNAQRSFDKDVYC